MKRYQMKIMALAVAIFTLTTHYCYAGSWENFARDRYSTNGNVYTWENRTLNGPYTIYDAWVPREYSVDGEELTWRDIKRKSKADFSNCTLDKGKIEATCWNANFSNAKLYGVEFVSKEDLGNDIIGPTLYCHLCDFTGAEFLPHNTDHCFSITKAQNVSFTGSNFDGAILNGGKFDGSHFWNTSMVGTVCGQITLKKTGEIISTSFIEAKFEGNDEEHKMKISDADFRFAILRDAKMKYVLITATEKPYTDFSHADLSGAEINSSYIEYVKFEKTKFIGANIEDTKIRDCIFGEYNGYEEDERNNFTGAKLWGTEIINSTFAATIFKNTMMTDVDFLNSSLYGTDFSNATLNDVTFVGTTIDYPDFSNANFNGVVFDSKKLHYDDDTFTGAKILAGGVTWDGIKYTSADTPPWEQ